MGTSRVSINVVALARRVRKRFSSALRTLGRKIPKTIRMTAKPIAAPIDLTRKEGILGAS